MRPLAIASLALAVAGAFGTVAGATCGGGGGGGLGGISDGPSGSRSVYRVPWKVLEAGIPEGDLKLLWIPASAIEARSSTLLESRYLTLASGRCVGFGLLPPKNPVRDRLAASGSTVVLTDRDGAELARVASTEAELQPEAVEKLLRAELDRREADLGAQLEAAERQPAAESASAVAALERVWSERCLFPKLGKRAARRLEKLGHPVDETAAADPALPLDLPGLDEALEAALRSGLEAESRLELDDARRQYELAVSLDPADPVALRYLGEFHRHHSGDWTEAKRLFSLLLELPADPVSRAVAWHGLGKMTIHGGDFARGLEMFDRSLAAWPLALTYRNLAVYWFSERDLPRAQGFLRQALALAPNDPYNEIFAAVYLAASGNRDEARSIAERHAGLLEASYNLAAVWAQLGDREKALELLARHFFQYERFDAVRSREMQEARDDFAFAPLGGDPAFVELTRGAELDPDSYHRSAATEE